MIDQGRIREAVTAIIEAVGDDPTREGLVGTPRRVAEMYAELFQGIACDPMELLSVGFEEGLQEMVMVKNIPFYSMCEHHFLPFYGLAHIAYMPNGRVVGVSKLARVIDILARRPQMQERLASQIADTVFRGMEPKGVAVVIEAEHLCMTMRGIKKAGSKVVTSANRGSFDADPAARAEFLSLLQRG